MPLSRAAPALFIADADPVSEEDAAREGSYPFTTITPNVGRGFIALPDPSPLLGLSADDVQPAYGFAPGLDIIKLQQAGFSSIGPLQQLVKDCGWQQQPLEPGVDAGVGGDGVLWRRVPVVVKDVAGLVPGGFCRPFWSPLSDCHSFMAWPVDPLQQGPINPLLAHSAQDANIAWATLA